MELHDPDVAVKNWVAVVLQMQRPLAAGKGKAVMDLDAVVVDVDLGHLLLGRGINRVALELNVKGLPGQGRIAQVTTTGGTMLGKLSRACSIIFFGSALSTAPADFTSPESEGGQPSQK